MAEHKLHKKDVKNAPKKTVKKKREDKKEKKKQSNAAVSQLP